MLTIIFKACLIATGVCSEFTASAITGAFPEFACTGGAQEYLADWQAKHPEYRIEGGWHCAKPGVEISKS